MSLHNQKMNTIVVSCSHKMHENLPPLVLGYWIQLGKGLCLMENWQHRNMIIIKIIIIETRPLCSVQVLDT